MATGRRDYTWGVLQDSIQPGRYTAAFLDYGYAFIGDGDTETVLDYTVPEGSKLFVTGLFICTDSPAINNFVLYKVASGILTSYFEVNQMFDFGAFGGYIYNAGERLLVRCENKDDKSYTFRGSLIGLSEKLV